MILVTGGNGYLGRALVERLVAAGAKVRVFCRRPCVSPAEVRQGDITDPEQVEAAMQGVRLVYHLAAMVDHYAAADVLHRVNVQGTRNVMASALRQGVERVVHCSSVSAEPGGGSTVYGRSKIAAEQALVPWLDRIPVVILRPGPIYDHERGNLRRLVRLAQATRLCPRLLPDVTVHIASRSNVVEAFLRASSAGIPGKAYAVCDRHPVARSVLSGILAQATGARLFPLPLAVMMPALAVAAGGCEVLHATLGVRPALDRHYLKVLTRARSYDLAPALSDLGFAPATTEEHFTAAVARLAESA